MHTFAKHLCHHYNHLTYKHEKTCIKFYYKKRFIHKIDFKDQLLKRVTEHHISIKIQNKIRNEANFKNGIRNTLIFIVIGIFVFCLDYFGVL